jgi:hypothetical protein
VAEGDQPKPSVDDAAAVSTDLSPPRRQRKTSRDRARCSERREWIRLVFEVAAFAVLVCYAWQTHIQAEANRKAAEAALTSAQTAERQLVLSERPWVKIESVPGPTKPLTYDDGGANLTLKFALRNVGHSPAGSVRIEVAAYPLGAPTRSQDYVAEQKKLCDPIRADKPNPHEPGYRLFPGDLMMEEIGFSIHKNEIDQTIEKISAAIQKRLSPSETSFIPVIVGCVDYRFDFAPDEHHQTPFIFRLLNKRDAPGAYALLAYRSYPVNELELEPWLQAGSGAD